MFAPASFQQARQQGTAMSDQSAGRIMLGVAAGLFAVTVAHLLLQPLVSIPGISRNDFFGLAAVLWAPLVNQGLGHLVIALAWTVPIGYLALKHFGLRHTAMITGVSWLVGGLALWMNAPYSGYHGTYILVAGLLGVLIARRAFGADKDGGTTATWLFLLFGVTLFFQTSHSVASFAAHLVAAAAAIGASWLLNGEGIRVRP